MKPWCLLLVCWATAALASAQLVTETFPLGAMTEAETTIILTHSISRDGKFILDRDKKTFTVTDTPEVLSILKAKLASRAQGQTMVRIEVLNQNQNNYRDQRWTSGPNVGATATPSGLSVGGNVTIAPQDQSRIQTNEVNQFLTVASGYPAYLEVAQQVPYPAYFIQPAQQQGTVITGVAFRSVGSRLAVRPTVMENGLIQVEITPEISAWADERQQILNYQNLSTTVTLRNGGTTQIGGFAKASSDFNRNFFTPQQRGTVQESGTMTLRATIVGTDPGAAHDLSRKKFEAMP